MDVQGIRDSLAILANSARRHTSPRSHSYVMAEWCLGRFEGAQHLVIAHVAHRDTFEQARRVERLLNRRLARVHPHLK